MTHGALPTRTLADRPNQLPTQPHRLIEGFAPEKRKPWTRSPSNDSEAGTAAFALHDARLLPAHSYGFDSWCTPEASADSATDEPLVAGPRRTPGSLHNRGLPRAVQAEAARLRARALAARRCPLSLRPRAGGAPPEPSPRRRGPCRGRRSRGGRRRAFGDTSSAAQETNHRTMLAAFRRNADPPLALTQCRWRGCRRPPSDPPRQRRTRSLAGGGRPRRETRALSSGRQAPPLSRGRSLAEPDLPGPLAHPAPLTLARRLPSGADSVDVRAASLYAGDLESTFNPPGSRPRPGQR